MPVQDVATNSLSGHDFYVLRDPFIEKVEELFPLPASVEFLSLRPDTPLPAVTTLAGPAPEQVQAACGLGDVYLAGEQVFIPLQTADLGMVVVRLYDAEPRLLEKMAIEWLTGFQASLTAQLASLRQIYTDPATDQYNSRACRIFFHTSGSDRDWNFFLTHVVVNSRTILAQRQRVLYTAGFLQAITGDALFYLGSGVFGLLSGHSGRDHALLFAHSLQSRLKREGMKKVQIGFCRHTAGKPEHSQDPPCSFRLTWQALAIAERHGPFGISDTAAVVNQEVQPFALPQTDILKKLRKHWTGLSRFGLALCVLEEGRLWSEEADRQVAALTTTKAVPAASLDRRAYILFPDCSATTFRQALEELAATLAERFGEKTVSIGASHWPCLAYSKTDTLRNASKALMHGSFYGHGEVVLFDHLSLNVSGDYYFEEGDHRSAARDFRNGLLLQPNDVNLLNSLGVTLIELNQSRRAIRCFEEVLRLDPGNYMALVNLGLVWQTGKNKRQALEFFEQACAQKQAVGEAYPELYQPLGRLYCELGLFEQAVEILEERLAQGGSDQEFTLHAQLARAYCGAGQAQQAIVACQTALQLFPQNASCLSLLGLLYAETAQGEEVSLALCRKALAIDEMNADNWYRLGSVLLAAGEEEEALKAARQCLELAPQHVDALLLLGRLYGNRGLTRRAARLFTRVLTKSGISVTQAEKARQRLESLGMVDESV